MREVEAAEQTATAERPRDSGECERPPPFRVSRPLSWAVRRRKATSKETLMSEKKAPDKLAHAKGTQKSARSTTRQAAKKAAPRADQADGESAVLAKIAAMPEPDRALGERLHALIIASAPALSPRLWYGMPGYARDGQVVCFFQS